MHDNKGQIKAKSIKSNYIYNVLYEVFALLAPLITTPYVSRVLGAEGVGLYGFTYSLAQYFVILGNLGVATYGQMAVASVRDDRKAVSKLFWELFILRGTTTILSMMVYVAVSMSSPTYRTARLILAVLIFASVFDLSWFFRGIEDFSKVVIRNFVIKIATIALIFALVKTKEDVYVYISLIAISTLLGNLTFIIPIRKILTKVSVREFQFRHHLKECMVFFLPTIATSVYTLLDKSMLGWLTGGTLENGYYEQSHKIEQILITVIISLNTIMRSRMSYLYSHGFMNEMKRRMNRSLSFIMMIAIPMAAGLSGIASNFIPLFLGPGYEKSIPLLQIFSLLFICIGLSNCLNTHFLGPAGRQGKNNYVLVAGACVNAICNYISIPKFGAIGAAVSSVLAEALILCGYLYLSRDFVKVRDLLKLGWKYAISGCLMLVAVKCVGNIDVDTIISLIIQVAVGVITYLMLLLVLNDSFLRKDAIEMVKSILSRGNRNVK